MQTSIDRKKLQTDIETYQRSKGSKSIREHHRSDPYKQLWPKRQSNIERLTSRLDTTIGNRSTSHDNHLRTTPSNHILYSTNHQPLVSADTRLATTAASNTSKSLNRHRGLELSTVIRLDNKLKSVKQNLSRSRERKAADARDRYPAPSSSLLSKDRPSIPQQSPTSHLHTFAPDRQQQATLHPPATTATTRHQLTTAPTRTTSSGRLALQNKLRAIEVELEIKDILLKNSRRDEHRDFLRDSFLRDSQLLKSLVFEGPQSLRLSGGTSSPEDGHRSFRGVFKGRGG